MTVVEVRSYSLISGNTSELMQSVVAGAIRAATRLTICSCAGLR